MRIVFNKKKNAFLCLMFFYAVFTLSAQEKLPVPFGNENQLFYLQRTVNTNTVIYELNYDNNILDKQNPVHVYWIRYNEQGQKEELNFLQRKFAYGVRSKSISKDNYEFHIVSCKNFPMSLIKGANNKYNVYATVNQKQVIVNRIFVKINGGSVWSPNVEYIEVKGTDPATGKEVLERMKI